MRKLIPPNITKTTLTAMIKQSVPEVLANRFWNTKALWLICMHKDDIRKVHIADLRGKYNYHGLDIIEMQAIWYSLPVWNDDVLTGESQKLEWRDSFKSKMDEISYRISRGTASKIETRNPVYDVSIFCDLI